MDRSPGSLLVTSYATILYDACSLLPTAASTSALSFCHFDSFAVHTSAVVNELLHLLLLTKRYSKRAAASLAAGDTGERRAGAGDLGWACFESQEYKV